MAGITSENATVKTLQDSDLSRYIQLASQFRQRSDSGTWEVGEKVPTV